MNPRAQSIGSHVFHIAITLGILVSGSFIAWMVLQSPTLPACAYDSALPDWTLLAIGVAAFVFGHYLGVLLPDRPPQDTAASQLMGRLALAFVFLGGTLVWIFEAIGTANLSVGGGAQLEPITYYTRCAIDFDASFTHLWFTRIAIFGIFLIAGHWFWDDALLPRRRPA